LHNSPGWVSITPTDRKPNAPAFTRISPHR
jgi:hypothetical protein